MGTLHARTREGLSLPSQIAIGANGFIGYIRRMARKPAPPPADAPDNAQGRAPPLAQVRAVAEFAKAQQNRIALAELQRRTAAQAALRRGDIPRPLPPLEPDPNRKRGRGRPQKLPADQWKPIILEEIADGQLLTALCAQPGWPSRQRVYEWMQDDPTFATNYRTLAREMGTEAIVERALTDARNATDAPLATLAWKAANWYAEKMNSRRYGQRVAVRREETPPSEMTDEELIAIATGRRGADDGSEDGEA